MRTTHLLLLAAFVLPLASPPAGAAPDREERKEASIWVKEEMNRRKKTLALLKKVKDEKSANKAAKALMELYAVSGQQTALGETGPARKPTGEAFSEAEAKNTRQLEKLDAAISAQRKRIAALELKSASLSEACAAMDAAAPGTAAKEDAFSAEDGADAFAD